MASAIHAPPPTWEIDYDARRNRVELWAEKLTHTFTFGRQKRFELLVLPNVSGTELHADVEYFCTEMEKWEKCTLPIRVDATAPVTTDDEG